MKVKFVNYDRGYQKYKEEYDEAYFRIMSSGNLILRQDVDEFEEKLAKYVGTKYAVALSNGTDALKLGMEAMFRNETILCPSHTFKSTCGAIIASGNEPDLYDLGETPRGRVGIVAHIAGELYQPPEVDYLIEDACQIFGGLKNPTSLFQAWSFYPAKLLGGFGDNGALTTNDDKVYSYVKEARNHFKMNNEAFGGNHRMDNLQAALLNVKLSHIDEILARRKEIANMYFDGIEIAEWLGMPNKREIYQDFIIEVPSIFLGKNELGGDNYLSRRNSLYDFLKENGVETMKNEYPMPCGKLPKAAKYEAETLRLPCNEVLTNKEVNYVIEKIKEFYESVS